MAEKYHVNEPLTPSMLEDWVEDKIFRGSLDLT